MALIEGDSAFFDHAGDDAGLGRARTDRANAGTAALRDLVNLGAHFCRGEERIPPPIHRRASRMRGLPVESDGRAARPRTSRAPSRAEDPDRAEPGPVRYAIRCRRAAFFNSWPRILHLFEIDPVFLDRVRQRNAVLVLQGARFIHVEIAGAGRRPEEAFAETRAFLIRPIDYPHRDRRLALDIESECGAEFQLQQSC